MDVEAATSDVIAACNGDARAAIVELVVRLEACEAELSNVRRSLTTVRASVSLGYVRGRGVCVGMDEDGSS